MKKGQYVELDDPYDDEQPYRKGDPSAQGYGEAHHGPKALLQKVKIVTLVIVMVAAALLFRWEDEDHADAELHNAQEYVVCGVYEEENQVIDNMVQVNFTKDEAKRYVEVSISYHVHHGENGMLDIKTFATPVGSGGPEIDAWQVPINEEPHQIHLKRMDGVKADEEGLMVQVTCTGITHPIVITMKTLNLHSIAALSVWIAGLILAFVYVLIVFELVHRTVAALLGSFAALGMLTIVMERPSLEVIVTWIDYETLCLLFGMMVMVGIFSATGFFEYCALLAYKLSKGNIWHLIVILCMFTAVVSAFLDNVTTMLLLTPVTVRLCNVLDLQPQPVLIAEVLFSNIGGTATGIGDPPNVIILSSKLISSKGIAFGEFTLHMTLGSILALAGALPLVRYLYKDFIVPQPHKSVALKREITVWRKTIHKLALNTPEEENLKVMLGSHVEKLEGELQQVVAESGEGGVPDIRQLEEQYKIRDWPLFINCSVILVVVVLLFFIHSVPGVNLKLGWIAVIGAITMLVAADIHDLDEVLEKVEWGTLLFFGGLFVLMEGLGELGLIRWIGDSTANLIQEVPRGDQLLVAIILLLWVSALVSAFIDNIPYTTAMIPVVVAVARDVDLPLKPLVWSLAFGTCMGGNGTLIGASANVVTAGLSEQQGYPISFNSFFRIGFPTMIITITVVTGYLLFCHIALHWDVPPEYRS